MLVCDTPRPRKHKKAPLLLAAPLLFGWVVLTSGCGGAASGSPPPSPISVSVTPTSSSVLLGNSTTLTVNVSNTSNTAVAWSVAGVAGGNATVGTISANGVFTAPQSLPAPNVVTVQASSVADPKKTAAAAIIITSDLSVNVAPAGSAVELGAQQAFQAAIASAGHPLGTVSWTLAGAGCSGAACGAVTSAGVFTAPQILPLPPTVLLTATSSADPSRNGSVAVTITSHFTLAVSGPSPVTAGNSADFTATLTPVANSNPATAVSWSVSGPGCAGSICGSIATIGSGAASVYTAPPAAPSPDQITITATPLADPSKAVSMVIVVSVAGGLTVTVSPATITLAPNATQVFTAAVSGSVNQQVSWAISGTACSGIGNPCGTIDSAGNYQAPAIPPFPNTLHVIATSAADPSRSGFAAVTISTLPVISLLLPSSATSGAAGGFILDVQGGNFAASSPGPGSTILVDGSARATLCNSGFDCTTTLSAADLALAGNLSVAVQNPDASQSAAVAFVIVPAVATAETIRLTAGSPAAGGKDITVVDLSTNGSSLPPQNVSLSLVAIGALQTGTNSCSLSAGPVELTPPASGSAAASLCAFSLSGLDPADAFTITGPSPADVTFAGAQPLGLGIVGLILQISANAQLGARTLFIRNANLDMTAATGALDVQ